MYLNTFEQCLRFSSQQTLLEIVFEPSLLIDYCQALSRFTALRIFAAAECDFGGDVGFKTLLHTLALAPELQTLVFSGCGLTDTSPAHFDTMPVTSTLRQLDLDSNHITDE